MKGREGKEEFVFSLLLVLNLYSCLDFQDATISACILYPDHKSVSWANPLWIVVCGTFPFRESIWPLDDFVSFCESSLFCDLLA